MCESEEDGEAGLVARCVIIVLQSDLRKGHVQRLQRLAGDDLCGNGSCQLW